MCLFFQHSSLPSRFAQPLFGLSTFLLFYPLLEHPNCFHNSLPSFITCLSFICLALSSAARLLVFLWCLVCFLCCSGLFLSHLDRWSAALLLTSSCSASYPDPFAALLFHISLSRCSCFSRVAALLFHIPTTNHPFLE